MKIKFNISVSAIFILLMTAPFYGIQANNLSDSQNFTENYQNENKSVIRLGLDLGSGLFKAIIAKYNYEDNSLEILKNMQISVRLGNDFQQSKDGMLSEKAQQTAIDALLQIKKEATLAGATEFSGIVTAVFRKAKNGPELLEKLREVSGYPLKMISQELEGKLGFKTAVALFPEVKDEKNIISFDFGNGSFQLSSVENDQTLVYEGPFGVSTIINYFVSEIRGQTYIAENYDNLNPISTQEMELHINNIQLKLADTPNWLMEKIQNGSVVAIGDLNSIFSAGVTVTGKMDYTISDLKEACSRLANKTSNEILNAYPVGAHDNFKTRVLKITTLYALMEYFGINEIHFRPSTGSIPGLLISPEFWEQETELFLDLYVGIPL